ncbi:MAG TPA: DUF6152 family protein [Gammaproteobacteria bacterium]|jgi:hypothetical protein
MRRVYSIAALLLLPLAASAHHSFLSRFDRQSLMELEGDVTALLWRNPHTYMTLRVADADGGSTDWEVETSSLSVLRRQGVVDTFAVGDHVRIAGFPPVAAKKEIYVRHVLLADGRELLMDTGLKPRWSERTVGGADSVLAVRVGDPSHPELGIFRVWSFVRNGPRLFREVVDPTFDVQSYPMTDAARAALAKFDFATQSPTANCAPKGMPTIMEQPYPIELVQLDNGDILLRIEEYDLERTVFMNGRVARELTEPTPLGFSTGAWDGRTLVVTTRRMSWPYFSQIGIPQSPAAEIVERFAPTEDGSRLDYSLTVTDSATFTEPVTLSTYWIYVPGVELLPYQCAERHQ